MSIKTIKYCNDHSKEKKENGECCQYHEAQVEAESLTYEQSFIVKDYNENNRNTVNDPFKGTSIEGKD